MSIVKLASFLGFSKRKLTDEEREYHNKVIMPNFKATNRIREGMGAVAGGFLGGSFASEATNNPFLIGGAALAGAATVGGLGHLENKYLWEPRMQKRINDPNQKHIVHDKTFAQTMAKYRTDNQ